MQYASGSSRKSSFWMNGVDLTESDIYKRAFPDGGIAQLVERLNGIQEVRGSTPLTSTSLEKVSASSSACKSSTSASFTKTATGFALSKM